MFTSATVAAVAAAASPTNAVNVTVDDASAGSDLEFNDDVVIHLRLDLGV